MAVITCKIVEVCVFRFVRDHPEFLLLKRSPHESIYPDLWQMVSGTMHEGERVVDAALREFKEETALLHTHFWVVPHVSTFYDADYDAVNLSPFFAAQVLPDAVPVLSPEHSTYEWLPYQRAWERLVWPGQRHGLEIVNQYITRGERAGLLLEVKV